MTIILDPRENPISTEPCPWKVGTYVVFKADLRKHEQWPMKVGQIQEIDGQGFVSAWFSGTHILNHWSVFYRVTPGWILDYPSDRVKMREEQ